MKLSISICLFLFALSLNSFGQPLPLDTALKTGKLSNGFTYFIRYNQEPKDRVVFYLVNKTGSIEEDEDQRGLAHFMEHMSFNGTKHYPKNQLVDYLQKSGVRFGADLNAYTSYDETVYQLPLPSDDPSIVQHGLQIMRDWAHEAMLETTEINNERGVVLEEKRLRNGAHGRMEEKYLPILLNGSRYALRNPIGVETVLKTFTPAAIKRYYSDWYRPNLQALIVVGDINVYAMEAEIKKLFGDLKNPANNRPRRQYNVPLTGQNHFSTITDPEQTSTDIQVLIKHKELPLITAADYRKAILRQLFNGALAARLFELSNKTDLPFVQFESGITGFMGGLDAFAANIAARPARIKEGFIRAWSEVERLKQFGFTQPEIDRQKAVYLNSIQRAFQEKKKTPSGSYVNEYVQYFLKGTASPGIDVEYKLSEQFLDNITLAEVNDLVKEYIADHNRDIVIMAPEKDKASLPTEKEVNDWIKKVKETKLVAYQDRHHAESLISTPIVPGSVVSKRYLDSIQSIELTLSNGARVILRPSDFKNDEILISAFSEGGTSLYPDSDFQSAANAAAIIAAGGLGKFSAIGLNQYMQGKSVQMQPYIQDRYEGITGGSSVKDFETALQLIYLYFNEPRKDDDIFENIIDRSKESLHNRLNDPASVFADTVNMVLGNYNFRRTPPSIEKLEVINLDRAFEIFKQRFSNATDFTFVIAGSIDTTTIIPLVASYLGSLPSNATTEKAKDPGIHIPEGRISRSVYKGNDNKSTVRLVYSGDYTYNSANNIQLKALGTILQYRVTERLREEEGGAYAPQAGVSYNKIPLNRYAFTIQFTCAPSNVEKLIYAANEEIEKLKTGSLTDDDITKFKAEQTRTLETQLRTNNFWVSYISSMLQNDEPLGGILYYQDLLSLVTKESLKKAATQYFNKENYIRLVLLPESEKK